MIQRGKITMTTEPIEFSNLGKLHIGPRVVIYYFTKDLRLRMVVFEYIAIDAMGVATFFFTKVLKSFQN